MHLGLSDASGQSLPHGYFLSDSIRIGSPVVYSLSFRHSPATVIVFPDTSYNFFPFELVNKQFFPTRTNGSVSLDSVVYTLMTFGIEPVQSLSIPIYVVSEKDSTPVFSTPDSVFLREMITGSVDTLSLKANTKYIPLGRETNYIYVFLILLGLVVLFGIFVLVFGKQIRKRFRLYRLQRRHHSFIQHFQPSNGQADQADIVTLLEKRVVLWKKYIESLADKPYSSYTTKEISDSIRERSLGDSLKQIDRTIYGGLPYDRASGSFKALQDFAVRLYEKRRKEIIKS
ncbi:MAG: hypothetical protein V4714_12315 [Bacteroidota bacterium]